jgi:hypothetical protein
MAVAYRNAKNQYDRLPALAVDLVHRRVAVVVQRQQCSVSAKDRALRMLLARLGHIHRLSRSRAHDLVPFKKQPERAAAGDNPLVVHRQDDLVEGQSGCSATYFIHRIAEWEELAAL